MNVSFDDIVTGAYSLSLETEALTGSGEAISLWGLENPSSPEINAEGDFTNYTPFDVIPGQSFAVIQLVP
jgi:hypothetical protein